MGITAFKCVIGGFTIANYILRLRWRVAVNEISDRKTADLPPQMTNLNAIIP